MAEFASKGVAGAGLGLGIAGTALGLAQGGLGGLLGGLGVNGRGAADGVAAALLTDAALGGLSGRHHGGECSENTPATRYDIAQSEKIAAKQARIDQLENAQATDGKILELYRYLDASRREIEQNISQIAAAQAVTNQRVSDDLRFVQADLDNKIAAERQQRCCADKNIVNYANQTFYAKLIAGVTATTDTTPQTTYNPLPCCDDGCCSGR